MANTKQEKVRMMLGQWGQWPMLIEQLRREREAALEWCRQDASPVAGELVLRIDDEIKNLVKIRNLISDMVQVLPMRQRRVLILRYINNHHYLRIGILTHYDERSVRRIEKQAVEALADLIFPEDEKKPDPPQQV